MLVLSRQGKESLPEEIIDLGENFAKRRNVP
jgi:hypothetical protein